MLYKHDEKKHRELSNFSDTFKHYPILHLDTNGQRMSTLKNRTLYTDHGGFILVKVREKNLLNFSNWNFHKKKMYAMPMRSIVKQWKDISDLYELKLDSYYAVKNTKAPASEISNDYKNIKCRLYLSGYSSLLEDKLRVYADRVEMDKYTIDDINEIDNTTFVCKVVDDLTCAGDRTIRFESDIAKTLGYNVVIVALRFAKNLKHLETLESVTKTKAFEDIVKAKVDESAYSDFHYGSEAEAFKKLTFKDVTINQKLDFITNADTGYNYVPDKYTAKYPVNKTLCKEYNQLVKDIMKKYPLLQIASNYKIKENVKEYQEYVELIDNKPVNGNNVTHIQPVKAVA